MYPQNMLKTGGNARIHEKCLKLIPFFCGKMVKLVSMVVLLKTYPQKMWKIRRIDRFRVLLTNLSTLNVDKFVRKCAEIRKHVYLVSALF